MSSYSTLIEDLEYELHKLRNLRDSQPEGSSQYEHFQEQAQRKADELILLENNTEALCDLDNELHERQRQSQRAESDRSERVRVWRLTTVLAGTAGVAVIGASLLVGLWVPVLLGVLALAGAVAAGYRWFRTEEETLDVVSRESARLQQARTERKEFARKVLPAGAR